MWRLLVAAVMLPVLIAGSISMAVARNQPHAVGEVWLCTGSGVVALSIDADGNPTGPMVPCPDCTLTLAALDGGASRAAPVWLILVPPSGAPERPFAARALSLSVPQARAPPLSG